ncbi:MAG: class I SAM-dependent methyltransferase [Quinella sp. 3Q1]|nr:class I SAM-dependent methyltransferase [Quinella sp. 3Q1]
MLQLLTNNNIRNIVDVGCGDFWIMRQVLDALSEENYNFFYTGVDVVEELVNYNTERFSKPNIRFICMDAASDEPLPDGQLLIIRQALQHMKNADIKKILGKAANFKYLFITEHIYDAPDAVYNIDKENDNHIRLPNKSGVYLEHAPFNIKNIVHLLKVPQMGGIIRSSLIIN